MTLSEIEAVLAELRARHPLLDAELLTTLLSAAGWEDKTIKDALILFKQKGPTLSAPKETVTPPLQPKQEEVHAPATAYPTENEITSLVPEEPVSSVSVTPVTGPVVMRQDGDSSPGFFSSLLNLFSSITFVSAQKDQPMVAQEEAPSVESEKKQEEGLVETRAELEPLEKEKLDEQKAPLEEVLVSAPEKESVVMERSFVPPVEVMPLSPEDLPPPPVIKEAVPQEVPTQEPQSLIEREEYSMLPPRLPKNNEAMIPEDLPLLPFESSPHVWSFSRYKDVFHKEDKHDEVILNNNEEKSHSPQLSLPKKEEEEVEELSLEKTPLNKEDQSLVFLAGIMLLVIILILGYMYSNGRL